MARLLDKSDFGLMAIANSIIAFGNIFAESGMGAAIIQRKDLTQKHINAALQGSLITGLVLFVIVYFSAPFIAEFFELVELNTIIKVLAINFFLLSLSSVSIGLLHKNYLFKESSMITVFSITLAYGTGIVLAINGYGVWSLVYASILYSFFKLIGYLKFAPVKFSFRFYLKEWKELFSFGFGMMLLKVNNYAASNGLNLVLGKIMSINVLGVFERAYQLKTMPSSYLGNIIDRIMYPAMSEVQDEEERLYKIFTYSLGLVNSILMPVAFYLIFFTEEIVLIMMGQEWHEAVVPLMIMFLVLPFSSSGRMADSVLRAKGFVYRNAWRKFIYVIVLITSASIGANYFGLVGASFAVTASYLFNYIFMLFLVMKVFKRSYREIIFQPVLEGLKLTMLLSVILAFLYFVGNMVIHNNIILFLTLTVICSIIFVGLLNYKPKLFGVYIYNVYSRIYKKEV